MKKKILSRPVYWTLFMLFYSLCISGLIWQLTMISMGYFKYDVVSDIKIIMPENDIFDKYFNFCYHTSAVLNYTGYEKKLKEYGMDESIKDIYKYKHDFMVYNLTFREQFEIAMTDGIVDDQWGKNLYLYAKIICHHMRSDLFKVLSILTKNLGNISRAYVQISQKIPNIEYGRALMLAMENEVSKKITISQISFYGKKLTAPYSDRCVNFQSYNFSSHSEAIASCIDLEKNQTKVCYKKIVSPNNKGILDYRRSRKRIFQECEKYDRVECDSHTIFTHLASSVEKESLDEIYKYEFTLWSANQPSYNITSKPKIDDVDLITYILGAMGSWIGFSFAGINPVSFFAQMKEGMSELISKIGLTNKNIKMIKSIDQEIEKNRLERERYRIESEKNKIERERNAILLQQMNEKMLVMNNELRHLRSRVY